MAYNQIFVNLEIVFLKVNFDREKEKILKIEFTKKPIKEFKENEVSKLIKDYFFGKLEKFDLSILNFDSLTDFQKKVYITLSLVPRGKVITYKGLSLILGNKNFVRAVGNALKKNPFPILIPCHRVIRNNFHIGKFSGGIELKRKLLEFENVKFEKENYIIKNYIL